jgi:hypothetical protein
MTQVNVPQRNRAIKKLLETPANDNKPDLPWWEEGGDDDDEREETDHQTARWDHVRDLRKHGDT